MDRRKIREAHRFRTELILLGMAIAKTGDRKKIFKEIDEADLLCPTTKEMLTALREKNVGKVLDSMQRLAIPVEEGEDLVESVIRKVKLGNAEAHIVKQMDIAQKSDQDLEPILEEALKRVKEIKGGYEEKTE